MNPYWNPKITTENGQLRATMGVVREVNVATRQAKVDVYVMEGDGSKTQAVWLPVAGVYMTTIEVEATVAILFFGDTLESGVVVMDVQWG